jgi:hypothetical protein
MRDRGQAYLIVQWSRAVSLSEAPTTTVHSLKSTPIERRQDNLEFSDPGSP